MCMCVFRGRTVVGAGAGVVARRPGARGRRLALPAAPVEEVRAVLLLKATDVLVLKTAELRRLPYRR